MTPTEPTMLLYRTSEGPTVSVDGAPYRVPEQDWDTLYNRTDLSGYLLECARNGEPLSGTEAGARILPPIGSQEVWAAGVTYYRSRTARMEESKTAGASDFYDRVYQAERPELFLKATPHRVVGPMDTMRLRADSKWIVPEPELTVAVAKDGRILGYTVGNDLSCRDIEGENPLYLPQAKVFDYCCSLGPAIWITNAPPSPETAIELRVQRDGRTVFEGRTDLAQMKREVKELVSYLFRDNSFPQGCLLMTGTGVVPPDDFTLQPGDQIDITIPPIGMLQNTVSHG